MDWGVLCDSACLQQPVFSSKLCSELMSHFHMHAGKSNVLRFWGTPPREGTIFAYTIKDFCIFFSMGCIYPKPFAFLCTWETGCPMKVGHFPRFPYKGMRGKVLQQGPFSLPCAKSGIMRGSFMQTFGSIFQMPCSLISCSLSPFLRQLSKPVRRHLGHQTHKPCIKGLPHTPRNPAKYTLAVRSHGAQIPGRCLFNTLDPNFRCPMIHAPSSMSYVANISPQLFLADDEHAKQTGYKHAMCTGGLSA
jgi:hypothetical protein